MVSGSHRSCGGHVDGRLQILLNSPVLLEEELKAITSAGLANTTFSLHYQSGSPNALKEALERLCSDVEAAVKDGCEIVVISDRVDGAEVAAFLLCLGVRLAVRAHD